MNTSKTPQLEGDALGAVQHRGGHLQIIAAAGSGKTEVVSQRVADLLADGVDARSIVAFTFTERAAAELKSRIAVRVEDRLGQTALDKLGGLFVGTIHAYCFRMLQENVPRYETYDVLDENQLTVFLSREAHRLGVRQFDNNNRLFASIARFLKSVDVIENELLDPTTMPEPFRTVLHEYYATLERYRFLTYGQQIAAAVRELEKAEVAARVHATLRHLIVDEYQDINPAQERLIELLAGPGVDVCVVGDDDQAIYQWRGSEVSNIVEFATRYPDVATFEITTNRRSRPQIIEAANRFAKTIPNRIEKSMASFRPGAVGAAEVVLWHADAEIDEAGWIAQHVLDLNEAGVPFNDIAVLVRTRAAYPKIIEQFATFGIPVQPGGRTGLFDQPEAVVLGQTISWLVDFDWRSTYGSSAKVDFRALLSSYETLFGLDKARATQLRTFLEDWKSQVPNKGRQVDLVGEFYDLFDVLDVRHWDLEDPIQLNRVGTLARFTSLLVDYESVRRRARPDPDVPGEQVGGEDRGTWYYKNLAIHTINYAQGAYEGFDGEADFELTGVDLTTIHRSKGLEWPAVFVPSLTANRLPSSRSGSRQDWLVPREMFNAARYEGGDPDERRLFYVAITRARDWVSVSRHDRVTKQTAAPSPYYQELANLEVAPERISIPAIEVGEGEVDDPINITYSDLAAFMDCGMAYRLRGLLGFQPRLAPELGYGKAVHHILRTVAEVTKATGNTPRPDDIDAILDSNFFLPSANKPAHRLMKDAARRLVSTYVNEHEDDLYRIWETERPFELHLEGVVVSGRADVILDREDGVPDALAIVDYKTSTKDDSTGHALQLQVYADAGRREGLDVRAAYVHDLKVANRITIGVGTSELTDAENLIGEAADRLKSREYVPNPGTRCRSCEVRTVCGSAKL